MYIHRGIWCCCRVDPAQEKQLVNAVNGYEKANAEVILNGSNMYTQYKRMQYETGFVPQQELMRNKDTVYYTLADAAKLRLPKDVPAEVRKKRVEEVMDIFGPHPCEEQPGSEALRRTEEAAVHRHGADLQSCTVHPG